MDTPVGIALQDSMSQKNSSVYACQQLLSEIAVG